MKNFGKGIGGALLSLAFVFGIVTAMSSAAQAQYRNDGYYQRGNSDRDQKEQRKEWKRRQKQARRDARQGNNQGDWRRDGVYNNGQYGNNGNYGDMRSIVRNLKNNARELQKHLDRDLDRSRYDGSRREDQLNGLARQFKDAVNRLSESNNGRQDNNVQRVLELGSQLERPLTRSGLDYHITEVWSEIRGDLRQLSNSYGGYNNNNNNNNRNNRNNRNGGYGNGTYNRPSWWPF